MKLLRVLGGGVAVCGVFCSPRPLWPSRRAVTPTAE